MKRDVKTRRAYWDRKKHADGGGDEHSDGAWMKGTLFSQSLMEVIHPFGGGEEP